MGCDSVATLELTIYESWSGEDDALSSCEALTWNDFELSETGLYTYPGVTEFGCDSVVTISFTLLEETSSLTEESSCDEYTWNGTIYTTSGTYDWLGENEVGCDSVATLELTIYESWSGEDDALSSCEALTWNDLELSETCLLYTSPSPRDLSTSRMPSSA